MKDFDNKIVLVTGAGRGLGRTLAYAFAARGAVVAANDITPVNLDQTLEAIWAEGGQARAYESDIAKKLQVQTMIQQVLEDFGRIDCLVNNAGVHPGAPLLDMDEWDWRRTIDVNLTGTFLCTQIAGRVMREIGGGAIVNIAAAVQAADLDEVSAVFAASKTALIGFTRSAARELAPHGIRVNAVCPAPILSSHLAGYDRPASPGDQTAGDAYLIHIADQVLALCSPASKATSQVVEVSQP